MVTSKCQEGSLKMQLPADYADRVYAGVLGKVIGVYLGRPFEGWNYEMIQDRLGDIEYYVHDKLDVPLIVTDDDISGTFTFLRALEDHGNNPAISAREVGESWLNYLIRERTILWWGGLGNSTEHTAYLRLVNGIAAPESGSAALNGKVVSEQIGAQIFIDGWAMVAPGDPDQAVRFSDAAATVSHDGEAVYGARVMVAMEAMAFVEGDMNKLIDKALTYIPTDSVIARMIGDVRSWHASEPDWRETREMIAANYGYDKYGGNCHMVPNHALIIHSLLHGEGDFSETLKIVNTCGWDTDCNSGNVGCLMGIKEGLNGIDAGLNKGLDWRGPVADRLYIPTADGGRGVSDCANEAVQIINMGRALAGGEPLAPKGGAQFHFDFPGSLQGFQVTEGDGEVANVPAGDSYVLRGAVSGSARIGSPVFTPSKDVAKYFEKRGYALMASPRVFPGQTMRAVLANATEISSVNLYVAYYGEDDKPGFADAQVVAADTSGGTSLTWVVPALPGPIFEVGLRVAAAGHGVLDLASLGWTGTPEVTFERPPHKGTMWRRAWVNGVDMLTGRTETFRLIQNQGMGLVMQGTREWVDYQVDADVTPHLAARTGIAIRVQGLRRFYGLLLSAGKVSLVKIVHDEEEVLAEADLEWALGETLQLSLSANGDALSGAVNGVTLLAAADESLDAGAAGLVIDEGRVAINRVTIGAVKG